jgi:hypothetical protein
MRRLIIIAALLASTSAFAKINDDWNCRGVVLRDLNEVDKRGNIIDELSYKDKSDDGEPKICQHGGICYRWKISDSLTAKLLMVEYIQKPGLMPAL